MPTTLVYRPTLIDDLVSHHRIGSYQSVFSPSNDVELMGVYLWNSHVCSSIYPLIGLTEVCLRNAVDGALRAHLGNFWWAQSKLHYKSHAAGTLPKAVENIRDNFSKATNNFKREQKKRYGIANAVPHHNGVVAKTEFSTWQHILDNEFLGPNLIWPSRLGKAFQGQWPSTSAAVTLNHARDLVMTIREFRNRLFHFEPAWKRFGVTNEADALDHLNEKIDRIAKLLELIHPEITRLADRNCLFLSARRVCTSEEIRRFQHLTETHKISSINKLEKLVKQSSTQNKTIKVRIYRGSKTKFLIQPTT